MSLADRPLAYCSNVHPAEDLDDLKRRLEEIALPVAKSLNRPLSVGLWLPRNAVNGLEEPVLEELGNWLQERGLTTATLNAFPFGNFHARKVKEKVYHPDWTDDHRRIYTEQMADVLAALLHEGGEGSISTLPCSYRRLSPDAKSESYFPRLMRCLWRLKSIRDSQGKTIRLALEPEPGCFIERTSEAVAFIEKFRSYAAGQSREQGEAVREHLGVCFDVCHSAVMFENPGEALRSIDRAGIRVAKIQISSALELRTPKDRAARKFLSQFVEERYLHQLTGKADDRFAFSDDLSTSLALMPTDEWRTFDAWRIHFHVPIHKKEIGPLHTTTWAVEEALAAANELTYAPDLEVETYTWDVLPAISRTGAEGLVEGLTAEIRHAQAILDRLRS